jgi:hypothetical protein
MEPSTTLDYLTKVQQALERTQRTVLAQAREDCKIDLDTTGTAWQEVTPRASFTQGTPFTYDPLPVRHARLLRFYRSETETRNIYCDFLATSLDQMKCPYIAISYCWGESSEQQSKHTIAHVDGRIVTVPNSAFNAIMRLSSEYSDLVLWIDALCIDQGSTMYS